MTYHNSAIWWLDARDALAPPLWMDSLEEEGRKMKAARYDNEETSGEARSTYLRR